MAENEKPPADAPAKDAGSKDDSAGKGGKLMPIILCVVVAIIVTGGAIGARKMLGGGKAPQQAAADQAKPEEIIVPETENGQYSYYEFTPAVVVNANVPRRDRYIRATLILAIPISVFDKVSKQIEDKKPELMSWLTVYLSGLTLEEVGGRDNLDRIRTEIRDRLNEQLWPNSRGVIHHVLFKEFAVQ
jgi:flagellar basal body-associated protein FliL